MTPPEQVELTESERKNERWRAKESVINFVGDAIRNAENVIENGDTTQSRARYMVRKWALVEILRWLEDTPRREFVHIVGRSALYEMDDWTGPSAVSTPWDNGGTHMGYYLTHKVVICSCGWEHCYSEIEHRIRSFPPGAQKESFSGAEEKALGGMDGYDYEGR